MEPKDFTVLEVLFKKRKWENLCCQVYKKYDLIGKASPKTLNESHTNERP